MQLNDSKNEVLDKILNSRYFLKSPSIKVLLKYLVQATNDNIDIKESVIGLHIYGEQYDGEKSNAKIRVSVYHLRKKLDEYYANEGANDAIKLNIEKGQYLVSFNTDHRRRLRNKQKLLPHIVYALVIVLLLVLCSLRTFKPKVPIWNRMLTNKNETVMYIGDVYGYLGTTITGGDGWQRDYNINSEEDLQRVKQEQNLTVEEVQSASYTYTTASEVDAVKAISRLYWKYGKDFSIRLASRLEVKDLKEKNIIYAGPFKTINHFSELFTDQFPQFRFQNNSLSIATSDIEDYQTVLMKYRNELRLSSPSEIAVVARVGDNSDTQQFLFFSDHDMGVRATVAFFTNIDSLKGFEQNVIKGKKSFAAIFLVNGKDRVDFGMKLLDVY